MKILWFCALIGLGAVVSLQADPVIKFDDLPSVFFPVPPGYHLLNWSNLTYLNGQNEPNSGYQAGVVSANNVIYNGSSSTGAISGGMFDFTSAYFTAAWNDNLQLMARGYMHGSLVYSQTNTLSATKPTLIHFNFYGVDEVQLSASGGTPHAGYGGGGEIFAMDDLSVVTYVPYAPSLVVNGGFETGNLTGWYNPGNTNDTSVNAPFAHSGQYGVQIGPVNAPGYLSQIIGPTQIGELYSVSSWLENAAGASNYFTVFWGGFPVMGLTNQPALAWTNIQLNLFATTPSEYLEFQFLNNPSYFGFDDVSVTPAVLVSNGGFETGDFSGWTPSGNSGKDTITTSTTGRRGGTYGVQFGAAGALGYISQTIPTWPGQPYLVSCWLNSPDGQTPSEFRATWSGQTLLDESNLGASGWTNLHFVAMNTSTSNTLQFGLRDDPSLLGLDEISVASIPILQNGGFEFGDFTGWTTSGNAEYCNVTTNATYLTSGFYGAQFGPAGSPGYFSQTVPTIPGQAYVIGFNFYNPTNMADEPVTEFTVSWNGTTLMDLTNSSYSGWLSYEFLVTAAGTNSTLQFGLRDDPFFLGLDDVFVSPLPAPAFLSVQKTNTLVNLSWSALPGYSYQLQYSTNLLNTNWNTLQDFFFPTNFPIITTDTNPSDTDRFYRVRMLLPPAS